MTQAEKPNTTNPSRISFSSAGAVSRRRLLASVPALAATTAPVVAKAMGALPTGSDAELLELGQKLAPLVAEINAARAIDSKRHEEFEARLAPLISRPKDDSDEYWDERLRVGREHHDMLHADEGRTPCDHREWDEIHEELFALLDDILDIQPTTLEGFAVQVLGIVTAHDDLCDQEHEHGWGTAAFFCNMCTFVGVPIPLPDEED